MRLSVPIAVALAACGAILWISMSYNARILEDNVPLPLKAINNSTHENISPPANDEKKMDDSHLSPPSAESQRFSEEQISSMCLQLQALHQLSDDGAITSLPDGMQPFGPNPCKDWLRPQKNVLLSPFGNISPVVVEQKR